MMRREMRQLPDLVDAASRGIAGSNLTVLNGASGVNEMLVGLVGQGLAVLELLRNSTAAASAPVPAAAPPGLAAGAVRSAGAVRYAGASFVTGKGRAAWAHRCRENSSKVPAPSV